MDKDNHSVFIPDDGGPAKTKNRNDDGLATMTSTSLIQRMGGSDRPSGPRSVAVALRGRCVVKRTFVRNKLSKEAVGLFRDLGSLIDGGLVKEGAVVDDGDSVSIRGEESLYF